MTLLTIVVTQTLSEQGFRSYATFENMIDHITVSNELPTYILLVHLEFIAFGADYTKKQPDHFPVSTIAIKSISARRKQSTNITCNGEANGTAQFQFLAESTPTLGVMEPMLVLLRI
jgi:hypothetical protein